jgi:hypothetical protein
LPHPGYIVRIDPGSNPPDTALAEVYKVPLPGYGIRGMDVDRKGVVWVPLDTRPVERSLADPTIEVRNVPAAAEGNKCPEGWTFYRLPGPSFQGDSDAAENPYYVWVDQHDILGLGPTPRSLPATYRIPCMRWSAAA